MVRSVATGLPVTNDDGGKTRMTTEQMDAIGRFEHSSSSTLSSSPSEVDRGKKASTTTLQTDSNATSELVTKSVTESSSEVAASAAIELDAPIVLTEKTLDNNNDNVATTDSDNKAKEGVSLQNTRRNRGSVSKIEALEIDMVENPKALFDVVMDEDNDDEKDDDDDDDDDDEIARDMERLLVQTSQTSKHAVNRKSKSAASSSKSKSSSSSCWHCCFGSKQQQLKRRRIGNSTVFFPAIFQKTGWGIVGPHWFGPPSVLLLLLFASSFFIQRATTIGPITTIACLGFTIVTAYNLCNAAFRDPGIVLAEDQHSLDLTNYRWCDFCNVYQPPDGAHCPDCNVCVAGYDHHCVWMGTCIGRKNFRQFVAFNLSWLFYLGYAIVWVTFIGPAIYKSKH